MPPLATSLFDLPWPTLLFYLMSDAVTLGGFITALVTWRKHPRISLIVATATAVMLLTGLMQQREQTRANFDDFFLSMSPEDQHWYVWIWTFPGTIATVVLTFTALMGRRPRNPAIIISGAAEAE